MAAKPRIVVVGAGMAGLSAAYRLHQACSHAFDLTILEGSDHIGGRIHTSNLGGDQIELGATFIHGITGSPIYQIAERIGALSSQAPSEKGSSIWVDRVFRAQGLGLPVDPELLYPAMTLYKSSISLVKAKGVNAASSSLPKEGSVGAFLRQKLESLLDQTTFGACQNDDDDDRISSICREEHDTRLIEKSENVKIHGKKEEEGLWTSLSLQESLFGSLAAMECIISACNTLDDLDLTWLKEYTEFPGHHITIGKGYITVLKELEKSLPPATIKFGKTVKKIFWNHSHASALAPVVLECKDGSIVEADHAVLTVSLGVLKAGILKRKPVVDTSICRSVQDLRAWKAAVMDEAPNFELFEPSLPSWKLDAISRLGIGLVNKLFILIDPSAGKDLMANLVFLHHKDVGSAGVLPSWLRRAFSLYPIYKGSNVLLCWLSGNEALEMEALTDEEVLDGVAEMLVTFRLGTTEGGGSERDDGSLKQRVRSMLKAVHRSKWGTNPLCQGSYSFVPVGSSGLDIDDLAKPLPKCGGGGSLSSGKGDGEMAAVPSTSGSGVTTGFIPPFQLLFAGETTHRNFYSTTHGAFLSGLREADRLLEHYHKKPPTG